MQPNSHTGRYQISVFRSRWGVTFVACPGADYRTGITRLAVQVLRPNPSRQAPRLSVILATRYATIPSKLPSIPAQLGKASPASQPKRFPTPVA